jgi:hypothetical protein
LQPKKEPEQREGADAKTRSMMAQPLATKEPEQREGADAKTRSSANEEDVAEVFDETGFILRCCLGLFLLLALAVAAALSAYFFYSPILLRLGPYLAPFSRKVMLELRREVEKAAHAKIVDAARPGARLVIKAAARRARSAVEAEGMQWSKHWESFL